jgi:hypothetical protein
MYGTKPGFYLLAAADWKGTVENGVIKVFRASTRLGMVIPRVFMDDTDADRAAIQNVVNQIAAYPLAAYDGKMKITEWTKAPNFPGDTGNAEVKWVKPELFRRPTVRDYRRSAPATRRRGVVRPDPISARRRREGAAVQEGDYRRRHVGRRRTG